MSSTYSPDLRIQLMGPGDQAGTWGNTTNTNLGGIIENAIAGVQVVTVNSTAQALTYLYGAVDQAQAAVLELQTGSVSAAFSIFTPTAASKLYVVNNQTSWTATFYVSTVLGNTTPAGTGVAIPAGLTATVWTDGTNFYVQNSYLPGAVSTGGNLSVGGSVTATNHIGPGTGLTGTATSLSIGGNAATVTSISGNSLSSSQVTTALGYTPPTPTGSGASGTWGINISGNSATVSSISGNSLSSGQVTGALGYTPPTPTGSGASGTWGINISGNAATATSATSATSATNATNATNLGSSGTLAVLAAAYPVGSIYMNASNGTNPASLLGFGTWAVIASGQMLLGNGSGYSAGSTGGSATTTLSIANLPSHSHGVNDPGHYHSDNGENSTYGSTSGPDDMQLWPGSHNTSTATTGISIQNTGSGTSFSTISPYLVVYMWQRTA